MHWKKQISTRKNYHTNHIEENGPKIIFEVLFRFLNVSSVFVSVLCSSLVEGSV